MSKRAACEYGAWFFYRKWAYKMALKSIGMYFWSVWTQIQYLKAINNLHLM